MMTPLIIISSEQDVENEFSLLVQLFDEGLELFHLRKPMWSLPQQRQFLKNIPGKYLGKISVHQHHESVFEMGLSYCHLKEKDRNKKDSLTSNTPIFYSTSYHQRDEVLTKGDAWDYCFLSPVFPSISKSPYGPASPEGLALPKSINQKVFALGGITSANAGAAFARGFYGIAALGFIWEQPERLVARFKELNELCRQSAPTC